MDSVTRALHYVHAFGILVPILFLDKVLAFLVIFIAFLPIAAHYSLLFIFATSVLGGYFLGAGMESVRESVLVHCLPALSRILHQQSNWHNQFPTNSLVLVYICAPPGEEWLHTLYCYFVRLFFAYHNKGLAKLDIVITPFPGTVAFGTTADGRASVADEVYTWTHEQMSTLRHPPQNQIFVISVTLSRPMTIEDWKDKYGESSVKISLSTERINLFDVKSTKAKRWITLSKMVLDSLFVVHSEDLVQLRGETETAVVPRDERVLLRPTVSSVV